MKKQKTNKKPKSLTVDENEFLQIIENISKKLAYKFKFGYHSYDDMKQQISIFALEGLKNYDHKRPLENFLWTHVRNRLFNYKRDNYQRPDKPCYTCPLFKNNNCTKYANKNDCELYSVWSERNSNKKNLMHLTTIDELKDYSNIFIDHNIENSEIISLIEKNINGEERSLYIKLKNGTKINKADTIKLVEKLKEIINIYGEKKRPA
jgi:DNA-directed RNA polymerase specialized sigma24 family protein